MNWMSTVEGLEVYRFDVRDTNAGSYAGLATVDQGSGFSAASMIYRISRAAVSEEFRGE